MLAERVDIIYSANNRITKLKQNLPYCWLFPIKVLQCINNMSKDVQLPKSLGSETRVNTAVNNCVNNSNAVKTQIL